MRPSNSFQARIATVLVLLLTGVIAVLYFAVQAATQVAVRSQANEQLEVGSRVFQQLLEVRGTQLQGAVQVLAGDFGFKDAVASGDEATLRSALANHGARIQAGVVMLLGLDGRLQVATGAAIDEAAAARLALQLQVPSRDGMQVGLVPIQEQIYLLVESPVSAPLPIARVVMGFRMDEAFAQELRALTHLELTLVSLIDEQPAQWVSTLSASLRPQLQATMGQAWSSAISQDFELDGQRFIGERLVLARGADFQVQALLFKSLDQAQQAFAPLDRSILGIALGALLLSLGGALLLARSLSQPVQLLALAAVRIGEGDYQTPVLLPRRDELGRLATAFNLMQADIAERERQLAHNALHDGLTGLPNRTLAMERLGSAITAERPTALLYLGIGNFRAVNESCGPGGGDLALQQLGRQLQATLRPGDSLARLVADEFLLLLENTEADGAVAAADKLQQRLLKPQRVGTQDIALDCRIGIAAYPADGATPDDLLRRAGIAMQDAALLPGRLQLYQEGRDDAHARQIALIRDLRRAAGNGELQLHFQPKLDLHSGRIRQAEALLRWQHPQYGMVSPGEFIPLAERTGSIQSLTQWVIEAAMAQLAEWNGRGLRLQLSLNISADDLLSLDLAERVGGLLREHRVAAEQLIFEITESAVMQNPELALQVLHRLRDCGISLSVDDFGTGYSSLAHLKRLPVQELKIDQSFVRDLDETSEDAVIVRSTIEMSHNLGLKVVAEGVELERSLRLLERWQCDTAQGYLISRPMPAGAFEAWVAQPLQASLVRVQR